MMNIKELLYAQADAGYAAFQAKLMPGIDPGKIIGVRQPALRMIAKSLKDQPGIEDFLTALPHETYDENNLHGLIISAWKDYQRTICAVRDFLPYVDNWATCDMLHPKCFTKHKDELREEIDRWLKSDHVYTVRYAIGMIMTHFLDEDFDPGYLARVAEIRTEEYYIRMQIAWYFATALAKQWDDALPYIENHTLDPWTHRKTIQKAVESYRITEEQKAYLKTFR